MNLDAKKLIQEISKEVNGCYSQVPKHSADTNLSSRIRLGYQLIFGVSNSDKMTPNINVDFYKTQIMHDLKPYGLQPTFLPFPYEGKDIIVEVLQGLSEEYGADLNIERLLRDVNFRDSRPIYLVITIIKYPVIIPIEIDKN